VARFSIVQSDLVVEAVYARSAFNMLQPGETSLHANIAENLSEFCEITADNVRINTDISKLSNANVTYDLASLNAMAQIDLERIQLAFFDLKSATREKVTGVTLALIQAVRESIPGIELATYSVTLAAHGVVEDVSPSEFTGRYASNPPEGLGPVLGSAVQYNFGGDENIKNSSLSVDVSMSHSNAAYVRMMVNFDAQRIELASLPDVAENRVTRMLHALGLEPE